MTSFSTVCLCWRRWGPAQLQLEDCLLLTAWGDPLLNLPGSLYKINIKHFHDFFSFYIFTAVHLWIFFMKFHLLASEAFSPESSSDKRFKPCVTGVEEGNELGLPWEDCCACCCDCDEGWPCDWLWLWCTCCWGITAINPVPARMIGGYNEELPSINKQNFRYSHKILFSFYVIIITPTLDTLEINNICVHVYWINLLLRNQQNESLSLFWLFLLLPN